MRILRRLASRLQLVLQSDTAFIESAYVEILGRPADQDGLDHYRRLLTDGLGRTAVLLALMRSDEFQAKLAPVHRAHIDLRRLRPERYRTAVDRSNGETVTVFAASAADDFDWLESMILEHGYYEQPGVWNFGVDTDKRIVAEMIAAFSPATALELGCAAGAVLECLEDSGVRADGVEISSLAIGRAPERVRGRIHQGDVLALDLPRTYDIVFGLDIFEHLNPNRLAAYVRRIDEVVAPGGYVYGNIPAFGEDPVFGTVFPLYLDDWAAQAQAGLFRTLHTDTAGFPLHGHLTWATAAWWTEQFEAGGFRREVAIERALHKKYDSYMTRRSPARRAFFVFSKPGEARRTADEIVRRIGATPSAVLG